jgi:hypothetical protein
VRSRGLQQNLRRLVLRLSLAILLSRREELTAQEARRRKQKLPVETHRINIAVTTLTVIRDR